MIACSNCGAQQSATAKYCAECGAALTPRANSLLSIDVDSPEAVDAPANIARQRQRLDSLTARLRRVEREASALREARGDRTPSNRQRQLEREWDDLTAEIDVLRRDLGNAESTPTGAGSRRPGKMQIAAVASVGVALLLFACAVFGMVGSASRAARPGSSTATRASVAQAQPTATAKPPTATPRPPSIKTFGACQVSVPTDFYEDSAKDGFHFTLDRSGLMHVRAVDTGRDTRSFENMSDEVARSIQGRVTDYAPTGFAGETNRGVLAFAGALDGRPGAGKTAFVPFAGTLCAVTFFAVDGASIDVQRTLDAATEPTLQTAQIARTTQPTAVSTTAAKSATEPYTIPAKSGIDLPDGTGFGTSGCGIGLLPSSLVTGQRVMVPFRFTNGMAPVRLSGADFVLRAVDTGRTANLDYLATGAARGMVSGSSEFGGMVTTGQTVRYVLAFTPPGDQYTRYELVWTPARDLTVVFQMPVPCERR